MSVLLRCTECQRQKSLLSREKAEQAGWRFVEQAVKGRRYQVVCPACKPKWLKSKEEA